MLLGSRARRHATRVILSGEMRRNYSGKRGSSVDKNIGVLRLNFPLGASVVCCSVCSAR